MFKKFFAAVVSAAMLICMAGCSSNYVMTEEDIALQKSIEGCWLADDSTGYNSYDENGNFLSLTAIRFTPDYKYLVYDCMPGDAQADGYVMTYNPTEYKIEEKMFRVDVNGVASYAKVSVSEDGQTLYWITDEQTDRYSRLTDEQTAAMGIPAYNPADWEETEAVSESVPESGEVTDNPETTAETESGTDIVSENTEEGAAVVNTNIDVSKFNFDRSVTLASENADIDNAPVLLWESENGMTAVYGMYIDSKEPYIFIEHDGVIDTFEQDWFTPRRIEPSFNYDDFDGDGADELAAIYYVGSGTGVSIEELVFYELRDGNFKVYAYDPVSFLESSVEADIDNEAHTVTFTLKTDGESVSYDTAEDYPNGIDEIGWGANIGYEFDGNKVILTAHPSVNLFYECMPKITARVFYWDEDDVETGMGEFTIDKEF